MRNSLEASHLYSKIDAENQDRIIDSILPEKKRLFDFNKKPKENIMRKI